ncbi:MAG: alpha/beta hydrolase [Bifidobacterium sp.]|uniref:alpha/beta hydrolase fold domain-containing protein n=1 Tax=Bifidobacterium sp. TaxID=41200 RepID=UPI0039E952CC
MTAISIAEPSPKILEPEPVDDIRLFPRSPEVPEGCIVVDDIPGDDFPYPVHIHKVNYVTREIASADRDERESIDLPMWIFEPQLPDGTPETVREQQRWPGIVFVRGSAFHEQNVLDYISYFVRLAERGFVVAAPKYRHSDIAAFPAQMQDCKTAVRFVRKNADTYHVDGDRIALFGDSSGGHTVLMAGFTADHEPDTPVYGECSSAVSCIVDWYGPTDFSMMNRYPSVQNHTDADSPEGFEIGHVDVLDNPELNAKASVLAYISEDAPIPPTLIMHGGRDMIVPFNQSVRLYAKLKECRKDVTFMKINNANHACLGFRSNRALDMVVDYIRQHM